MPRIPISMPRCYLVDNLRPVVCLFIAFFVLQGCAGVHQNQTQVTRQKILNGQELLAYQYANDGYTQNSESCVWATAAFESLNAVLTFDEAPLDSEAQAKNIARTLVSCGQGALAEYYLGRFYLAGSRPGLAVKHLLPALATTSDDFQVAAINSAMAESYNGIGNFDLRDEYLTKALQAYGLLESNGFIVDQYEWSRYKNSLEQKLFYLGKKKDITFLPQMLDIWKKIEEIISHKTANNVSYVSYLNAAIVFSSSDSRMSWQLIRKAESLIESNLTDVGRAQLLVRKAEIEISLSSGRSNDAARMADAYLRHKGTITGQPPDSSDLILAGLAFESAGRLDDSVDALEKAIEKSEYSRKTIDLHDRTFFLNEISIRPYWGLLRAYAKKYLKSRSESDFWMVVKAERKLRSRQFNEISGAINDSIDIARLKLSRDEVLISYVVTDTSLVTIVISNDWKDIFIRDINAPLFEASILQARNAMQNYHKPGSVSDIVSASNFIITPLIGKLVKYKKLIVIPDGVLYSIPFSALLVVSKGRLLVQDYEISYTPSLDFFTSQRHKNIWEGKDSLIAIADPIYGDPILPEIAKGAKSRSIYLEAVKLTNIFVPLPETRDEVIGIGRFFSPDSVVYYIGVDATKRNIKDLKTVNARYLHFATHGILANMIPGVDEPALVLSKGESYDDSFFRLSDLNNLHIESDLTVLSACDTGRGKYFSGEGIMGMGRGFLLAGSRNVLVSLWPISSADTVKFMVKFYNYLVEGKSKSVALRMTQADFLFESNINANVSRGISLNRIENDVMIDNLLNTYIWAPFVLIGGE